MIVFASVSGICFLDIFSRICSSWSIGRFCFGWNRVSIFATRFGLLCSWIRTLKSSILFFFRISLISSGLRPNSWR